MGEGKNTLFDTKVGEGAGFDCGTQPKIGKKNIVKGAKKAIIQLF